MPSLDPGPPDRNRNRNRNRNRAPDSTRNRTRNHARSVTEPCPACDYPIATRHRQRIRGLFNTDCLLCHVLDLNRQLRAARGQLAAAHDLVRQIPAAELSAVLIALNSQPITGF